MRAVIVLAAGQSSRFRGMTKLLAPYRGRVLIDHALDAARAVPAGRIIVVVGHDRRRIALRAVGRRTIIAIARQYRAGLAESLRVGLNALWPIERQLFVFLADMPVVPKALPARLARALQSGDAAVRPRGRAGPGHPVLLRRPDRSAMARLRGDSGLGALIAGRTRWIATNERHAADIDTRRDLSRRR